VKQNTDPIIVAPNALPILVDIRSAHLMILMSPTYIDIGTRVAARVPMIVRPLIGLAVAQEMRT
jgi:hypothetical protein